MKAIYNEEHIRNCTYDTVVLGGGVAGTSAAIASARGGAKTLLVEASGVLGGIATLGIVTPLSSECSKSGKSFGGLVDEILEETEKLTRKYVTDDNCDKNVSLTAPHITKYVLLKLAVESGVNIAFHTTLCDAEYDKDLVKSVILHDKSGYIRVLANNFIDATGDADLICLCSDNYVSGSEIGVFDQLSKEGLDHNHESKEQTDPYDRAGLMQPVSQFFIMRGVDMPLAMSYNNKRLHFGDLGITKERFEAWEFCGCEGFEIQQDCIPMPQSRILVSYGRHRDEAVVNMSRITKIDGSDGYSVSEGEIKTQLQVIALVDFLKTFVPGFENSYLVESSSHIGVRESRRLVGRYKLTGTDVINSVSFYDTICKAYYLIDIHDPKGRVGAIGDSIKNDYYEIPFRSLCSAKYNNLLAVGRCISVDHIANSATRIQGSCILTGQAAGTACAISKRSDKAACNIDTDELIKQLKENGVDI
jgi:hypothetical protein